MNIEKLKHLRKHFKSLKKLKRKQYHPLIHKIHKEHRISKRTLFYVKEYGPKANVVRRIIKESLRIVLFTSLISSFGGFALESIKQLFITVPPLIFLLPVLNDMIGNYGSVISARFSTMLHEYGLEKRKVVNKKFNELVLQLFIIAIITSLIVLTSSFIVTSGVTALTFKMIYKVVAIVLLDVIILLSLIFFIAGFFGIYYYMKQEDPNNFLIPITTSIADFGNMLVLTLLVILFF